MKKIIFALSLALVAVFAFGAVAYAQTDTEKQIEQLALQNDKVKQAKCLVHQRKCVIAVKTEKFTTQSEYSAYVDSLVQQVKSQFSVDTVIVTRNPKVMHEISRLADLSETERTEEIQRIFQLLQGHKHVLPRQ